MYLINLNVGNEGEPGAPILNVQAAVDAPTGHISGQAKITQAIAGPESELHIRNLTGQIRSLGFGPAKRIVTLTGDVIYQFPPPAIGQGTYPFTATLGIDQDNWDGRGSFSYGPHHVEDVPVTPVQG